MWPTMDMTAAVRVKARRAACQAPASGQRARNHLCMVGATMPSTWSSSSARDLSCASPHRRCLSLHCQYRILQVHIIDQ